jgi:hypothetical protein
MNTQRFKSTIRPWNSKANNHFMGFTHLLSILIGEPDTICWDTSWIKKR